MVMQSKDGTLVVIDGGWDSDSAHLLDVIRSKGGHVSGWFITHPHSDHAGALIEILNNPDSQITIDNVYYKFTDQEWYDTHGSGRGDFVVAFGTPWQSFRRKSFTETSPQSQEIQLGDIRPSS